MTNRDQYGEVISAVDGRGIYVADTFDSTGITPTATLNGQASSYTRHDGYNTQGDRTSVSMPPITTTLNGITTTNTSVTTSYGYDGDGHRTSVTTANGNTTAINDDHIGRVVQTTLPTVTLWDGTTTAPTERTGYDGDGNVVLTQDANGGQTTHNYDPWGRPVATTNPISGTSLITYTATREAFDQDPQGDVTAYSYNAVGEVIRVSDPVSETIQYDYTPVGATKTITTSDGSTSGVISVDALGYNALTEQTSSTLSGPGLSPQTTLMAYDLDGNVAETQQPNGDVTLNTYDLADQLTNTNIAPANGATPSTSDGYGYDLAGNQTDRIDADNRDHQTTYDADNRAVAAIDWLYGQAGTTTITTTTGYDPDGNTVTQTTQTLSPSGLGTHTYAADYNADDQQTSETNDGVRANYGYDAAGQQRQETSLNNALRIATLLDPEGRATAIGENLGGTGPYTSTFAYNPDDLPTTVTMPGGVQEIDGYDRGTRLVHSGATGPNEGTPTLTLGSGYDYGYDGAGRTISITTTLNGQTPAVQMLAYDARDRLTQAQGGGVAQAWTYDANGNMSTTVTGTTTTTYGYSANMPNMLQTLSTPGQPTTYYGYDAHGDATSITNTGAMSTGLTYDRQARLVGVTLKDGTAVTMTYNATGQRASYIVAKSGQPTLNEQFQYRGDVLGQATVVSGTQSYTDTYIYQQDGTPLELLRQQGGVTSRYWYVEDGRRNVVALTDSTGAVVDRYSYDVWGQPTSVSESVPQPWRYAGYWYDRELGWYWVRVRPYDPALKRWLQPDPSQADGVRTYVYVDDSPVDSADPSGFCKVVVRFRPLAIPLLGRIFNHAYILTSDSHNAWICEANPDAAGFLHARFDRLTKRQRTEEADRTLKSFTVVDDKRPCSFYNNQLIQTTDKVNNAYISYDPTGEYNSNSFAYTAANRLRGGRQVHRVPPDAPVPSPGWGETIPCLDDPSSPDCLLYRAQQVLGG